MQSAMVLPLAKDESTNWISSLGLAAAMPAVPAVTMCLTISELVLDEDEGSPRALSHLFFLFSFFSRLAISFGVNSQVDCHFVACDDSNETLHKNDKNEKVIH